MIARSVNRVRKGFTSSVPINGNHPPPSAVAPPPHFHPLPLPWHVPSTTPACARRIVNGQSRRTPCPPTPTPILPPTPPPPPPGSDRCTEVRQSKLCASDGTSFPLSRWMESSSRDGFPWRRSGCGLFRFRTCRRPLDRVAPAMKVDALDYDFAADTEPLCRVLFSPTVLNSFSTDFR